MLQYHIYKLHYCLLDLIEFLLDNNSLLDKDIFYVDIEEHMRLDRQLYSPDGIHYSSVFHRIVSDLLTECMEGTNELF